MDHLGLFTELEGWSDEEAREEFRCDIAEFHVTRGEWGQDEHDDYGDLIVKFLAAQSDGVAFNAEGRECVSQNSHQWGKQPYSGPAPL